MKSLKLIIISLTICILSSVFTFFITSTFLSRKQSLTVNKEEKATDLYSANLTLCRIFKECNHTATDSDAETITFSSTEELLRRFPGYKITSGENDAIVLSAEVENYCPDHYRAVLSASEITITRLSDGEKITSFEIIPRFLSENEKSLLEQGITLNSQKALTSFIEDFTS